MMHGQVYKLCALLLVFAVVSSQQQSTSLDDLINSVFNTNAADNKSGSGGNTGNTGNTGGQVFQPTPTKTTVLNGNEDGGASCGQDKQCVKRFLCKNDEIITDGVGLIDIRIGGDVCGYLEVCCDIPNKLTEPINPIKPPEPHEGCGYRNPDGVGYKIVGGSNEAEFGEFPWMVAILREEKTVGEVLNLYECGGSIIAPNVVITSAHCVQTRKASELVVRAGEWDTQTKTEILPHQDRHVREIIVHEKFNKGALFNDIAILIVDTPFVWEENVRPICLPEIGQQDDYARCFGTGWGKDKFGKEGKYQVFLKKIELPLVDHEVCQRNLRTTRLGAYFNLHESFLCAGGEKDKDTCKGDGGSPLSCPLPNNPKRFYLSGLVAWGVGCGEENIPGVYAKVSYLRPWLDEKLHARNIDFSYFTAN